MSLGSNLPLNPSKSYLQLLCKLFWTSQLSAYHSLDSLKWDDHIKCLSTSCYGTLIILKKNKNFTTYCLTKHLVENLILSRLDFSDIVFYPVTKNLLKRLERIQFSAASFVNGRYVNNIIVLSSNWVR